MVSYSVAWHPCLQPAIMASAGWSGFDTLEPARWVGGTGAMIRGLEDGLDKAARCASQRAIQGRGVKRRADKSERSEQELVLMPIV